MYVVSEISFYILFFSLPFFSPFSVTDRDSTPPVIINCPGQTISARIPFGTTSFVVGWSEPIATDNSGLSPTVTQSHRPGDVFSIGTTQVLYTFTDGAGNEAVCSFTVEICKCLVIFNQRVNV